ncbi:hypothetical protein MMC31_004472 [Peltigera leucophlebia]|nr:hypothetical protein [Peltigera leucophlebia]
MDQQYKRVLDPACSVADGVFFWKGRFTDEQAQSLRGNGLVKAIITNVKAEADRPKEMNPGSGMKKSKRQIKERQTYNSAEAGTLIPQFKSKAPRRDNPSSGHGIDRRDPMKVWRREVEDVGLNYLSTAPGKVMKRYYTYGIDAGKDVLVIVLDTGFPSSFVDIGDQNRILSRNTANLEATPNGEEESFGACTVEKIGGIGNGVAWHTQFALFEVTHDFDNFLQALASIDSKLDSNEIVPSSNGAVMNIRLRYIPISTDEEPYFAGILKWRMKPLIAVGIIIVTSAGASQSGPTDVITSYPAKLARDLPIVSVGFVDPTEASEPIGPHGNGVSVFAPYLGKCHGAMPEPQYFKGAGVAVATVTGLVAYYLSLAQLKETLKTEGVGYDSWDWVRGVYAYIRRMGYERGNWAEHAVWNGHDNDDVGLWYGVGPLPEGAFW